MVITKEWVDQVCPEHSRTSCNNQNLSNAYGGWTGYYDRKTGKKEIQYPRCTRCYLLDHLGVSVDSLEFRPRVTVFLEYKENKERC
jgi:hypothetical protein